MMIGYVGDDKAQQYVSIGYVGDNKLTADVKYNFPVCTVDVIVKATLSPVRGDQFVFEEFGFRRNTLMWVTTGQTICDDMYHLYIPDVKYNVSFCTADGMV